MNFFLLNIYVCVFYGFLFPALPKIIFLQIFKSCKSGFVPQSMLFVEGGKYLRRLHFIPKQLKYLKPFIPKQLKLPNPPLSKQFLHFILAVTTSNTQRFKQFKLYLFADTTNKNLFLAIKSDSIAMNFKQLVNSVTFYFAAFMTTCNRWHQLW